MSNIVTTIIDYIANVWHNTDQDIVMAEHINAWENQMQNVSQFLSRYAWHPNTSYPKGAVILYPFGLHTKLVSQNAGTSGSKEPTWSDAQGQEGSRTVTDNDIIWKEMPMEISSDTTPIGTIKQQLWHTAPPGYIKLDVSQVLNRADYPELWQYVQNYMPLLSETDWQKQKAKQNTVGFFSSGDGNTTFRTPVIVDFVRGGTLGNVGNYTADQNKKHSHNVGTNNKTSEASLSGSFQMRRYYDGGHIVYTDRGIVKISNGAGTSGNFAVGGHAVPYNQDIITVNATHDHDIVIQQTGTNVGGDEARPKNIIMPFFLRALNI